ncbi:MAG: methyltransferase domain-containing protein [Candidatus Delongbacteria bacterium]|nr:methyltransferase domain-containing protein [Candidatus Delongbacteria bacterium]
MQDKHYESFIFQKKKKSDEFLERFKNPDFVDKIVLDFGCGLGALSFTIAERGAKKVIGLDLNSERIHWANDLILKTYSSLKERIYFVDYDIFNFHISNIDYIVSKATFEHINNLEEILNELKNKLKSGGKIFAGFGPLYDSPYGDIPKNPFPWAHKIIPSFLYFPILSKLNHKQIKNISDLGINGYSYNDYIKIFYSIQGLRVEEIRLNVSNRFINKYLDIIIKIPFIRRFFIYNIYVTFCKI